MADTVKLVCPSCGSVAEYPRLDSPSDQVFFCPECGEEAACRLFLPEMPLSADNFGSVTYQCTEPAEDNGVTKDLALGEITIGRKPLAPPDRAKLVFRTEDRGFSRCHFTVNVVKKGSSLIHTVSLNGNQNETFLNAVRMESGRNYPLRDGDRITVSTSTLYFNYKPSGESTVIIK